MAHAPLSPFEKASGGSPVHVSQLTELIDTRCRELSESWETGTLKHNFTNSSDVAKCEQRLVARAVSEASSVLRGELNRWTDEVQHLEATVAATARRLAALEVRVESPAADLLPTARGSSCPVAQAAIASRVDKLEGRLDKLQGCVADVCGLMSRVDEVERTVAGFINLGTDSAQCRKHVDVLRDGFQLLASELRADAKAATIQVSGLHEQMLVLKAQTDLAQSRLDSEVLRINSLAKSFDGFTSEWAIAINDLEDMRRRVGMMQAERQQHQCVQSLTGAQFRPDNSTQADNVASSLKQNVERQVPAAVLSTASPLRGRNPSPARLSASPVRRMATEPVRPLRQVSAGSVGAGAGSALRSSPTMGYGGSFNVPSRVVAPVSMTGSHAASQAPARVRQQQSRSSSVESSRSIVSANVIPVPALSSSLTSVDRRRSPSMSSQRASVPGVTSRPVPTVPPRVWHQGQACRQL